MSQLNFILADKPSGVSTHRVSQDKIGFCEWLEIQYAQKLSVVHRLDKETTGTMVFAATKEAAQFLTEQFTLKKIQKTYLFITDKKPQRKEWSISSHIEQNGKIVSSDINHSHPNSQTDFRVMEETKTHYLIEARPHTGKTHQIRLHAKDSGIPLLGDTLYGGSPYSQFFLHCLSLKLDGHFSHTTEPPLVYKHLDLLSRRELCQWLMSFDRRLRLYPDMVLNKKCLRLIHHEGTPLRADQLGDVVHAGWWSENDPTPSQLEDVKTFFNLIDKKNWSLQTYKKQKTTPPLVAHSTSPASWEGVENNAHFQFKNEVGISSSGLFLDQRDQRHWVKLHSDKKRVLNLFAYTGGFSVMAALGGASSVVTVDLSKKYIEWAKENFNLNNISLEPHKFYDMDSLDYLNYAIKKSLEFDIIICDPPSFSRNKNKTFRVEKDFVPLIQKMAQILSPQGLILFSTNYEQWDGDKWEAELKQIGRTEKLEITRILSHQWDFEIDSSKSLMKAFQIKKETIA